MSKQDARRLSRAGINRRDVLRTAAAGALAVWASRSSLAQQKSGAGRLTDKLGVIDGGGPNILAFSTGDGILLVDSGVPKSSDKVMGALKNAGGDAKIQTVINTHYHLEQTGNNEVFGAADAAIIAHDRTRQWMSNDYWIPAEDRYEKARPKAARPTKTFQTKDSLKAGDEQIDCGYLTLAHTSGDIYVYFRNANVLAVGDVASPVLDPSLDYFTGAWIGGRVDAMDTLLALANDQTKIVPGTGPVMTKAEFKAERDLMDEVRARLFKLVREGDGPKDMLDDGALKGLPRTWKDPDKFLYAAAKGLWGHHNKLDPNVV